MANKRIKDLSTASSIASGQYLAIDSTSGGTLKIDYNLLAKAIIEQYASSTLAGSAQTLQSAINSLNSNLCFSFVNSEKQIADNDDLNNYSSIGNYRCASITIATTLSNCPVQYGFNLKVMYLQNTSGKLQLLISNESTPAIYFRKYSGSGWTAWLKISATAV